MKVAAFYENVKDGAKTAGKTLEEAFVELKAAGMDLIYANFETFRDDLPELREIMDRTGIGLEGFYGFLDMSHNPDEEKYKECIDLCAEHGGTNVLLLPGIIFPNETDRAAELEANMVKGMTVATAYGIEKNIHVTMEDFDGMVAPYNCIKGMLSFMNAIPDLRCSFDTGNFIMFGEDSFEAFHQLKDRIVTVHCKDRSTSPINPGDEGKECADGSVVYPCTVGRGYIRIADMIAELKADGYEGNFIAELYSTDASCMLAEIVNSVKFLKAQIDA